TREFLKTHLLPLHQFDHLRHVITVFFVKTTADVREADDFVAGFLHEIRSQGTDIAESLNHNAAALLLDAEFREGLIAADHHASAGGLAPAARAAEFDGLTGDDGGGGLTNVHRVS